MSFKSEFKKRIGRVKKAIFTRPYVFYFIIVFLVYMAINVFVNQLYVTAPVLLSYNLKIIIPFIIFSFIVPALVAVNVNLSIMKFKDIRKVNKESGLTFIGVFGGILGGACPSCFVGLFPAVLGIFGISASLSSLPFFGLEIQVGSTILLLIAIIFLTRDNVCKIKIRR